MIVTRARRSAYGNGYGSRRGRAPGSLTAWLLVCILFVAQLHVSPMGAGAAVSTIYGWTWQNPLPQGNRLLSADFVDATTGWAVGGAGTILKTTDGGETWVAQLSGTGELLASVAFVDSSTGWVVGAAGTVLKTTDGGETWKAQSSATTRELLSVHFVNERRGWAVGAGVIRATTDGGATWVAQSIGMSETLNSVHFANTTTGWAVGRNGTILVTRNAGTTWNTASSGTTKPLQDVHFVDDRHGWAVGGDFSGHGGVILATSDGGTTWTEQDFGDKGWLDSVTFTSVDNGWVTGGSGIIMATADGGVTWTEQDSVTGQWLHAVTFADSETGWVVGARGTMRLTTDGGATWAPGSTGTTDQLNAVHFADQDHGWAVGGSSVESSTIVATTDGGTTWIERASGADSRLYSVSFIDVSQGWAVGRAGTVLATTDGGSTWAEQDSGTSEWLTRVHFVDGDHGWVLSRRGTVRATTDGGATWSAQFSDEGIELYDISFTNVSTGWAVGEAGTILATTDGGVTWVEQASRSTNWLSSVHFVDPDHGWVVGARGTILATTDGGATWATQDSGTSQWLNSVHFTDVMNGCAVGRGGTILITADGGASWVAQDSGTREWLTSVHLSDVKTGWAVGYGGTVLRYDQPEVPPVERLAVSGTITDAGTGDPIAGVYVKLEGRDEVIVPIAVTDGSGRYSFDIASNDVGWSVAVLAANQPGVYRYEDHESQAFFGADSPVVHDIALEPLDAIVSIAGVDRFETAALASQRAFANSEHVIIATGRNWPDALGGAALAGVLDAPVLLVEPDHVPVSTADEIRRLGATSAVVLGGTSAIEESVEEDLSVAGLAVERIAGDDRYGTADAIASRVIGLLGDEFDGRALLATGRTFPDALAAAPLAAANSWPVLLAHPSDGLVASTEVLMAAAITDVLILGEEAAVSEAVERRLEGGGYATERLGGENRYTTAVAIATYAEKHAGHTWRRIGVATGRDFPDALAGGVVQGTVNGVMLLVEGTALHPKVTEALGDHADIIASVTYFGGSNAVSAEVREQIAALIP